MCGVHFQVYFSARFWEAPGTNFQGFCSHFDVHVGAIFLTFLQMLQKCKMQPLLCETHGFEGAMPLFLHDFQHVFPVFVQRGVRMLFLYDLNKF